MADSRLDQFIFDCWTVHGGFCEAAQGGQNICGCSVCSILVIDSMLMKEELLREYPSMVVCVYTFPIGRSCVQKSTCMYVLACIIFGNVNVKLRFAWEDPCVADGASSYVVLSAAQTYTRWCLTDLLRIWLKQLGHICGRQQ